MYELEEKILDTIKEYSMIKSGDHVTAALSGGADSVCLLMALNGLSSELGCTLSACHVNHLIRGDESDRDEDFCRELCGRLGIPIKIYREDVPAEAERTGRSLELTARDVRYRIFSECGADGRIATAHTLSDSAETVIHNMIRGTGLKGLCGIPPVRGNIIRPLLGVTRQDVEKYLEIREQDYVTDSTNLSDDYTRNKIRHNIMAEVLKINGGFYKIFANEQKILNEENNYLEKLCEIAYNKGYDGCTLTLEKGTDDVIKKRAAARFLGENRLPVSYDKISDIVPLFERDGRVDIGRDVYITGRRGKIFIEKKSCESAEKKLVIGDNSIFEGIVLNVRSEEYTGRTDKSMIDPDKLSGDIVVRDRRFGDKIKLAGKAHTSSVKKLLNEKVAPEKRKYVHFLADSGGLIYMEGFGAAQRAAPDESTKRVLIISVKEGEGLE